MILPLFTALSTREYIGLPEIVGSCSSFETRMTALAILRTLQFYVIRGGGRRGVSCAYSVGWSWIESRTQFKLTAVRRFWTAAPSGPQTREGSLRLPRGKWQRPTGEE